MLKHTFEEYLDQIGLKVEEGKSVINLRYDVDKDLGIEDKYLYGLVTTTGRDVLLSVVSIGVIRCIFGATVQIFGIETAKKAFETGGWIYSWLRAKKLFEEGRISNLDGFLDYLRYDFQNLGYGILTKRESEGKLYIKFEESMTSSGMANKGMDLCAFECGRIVGGISFITNKDLRYKEIKCWGLGDNYCEIEIEFIEKEPDTTILANFSNYFNLKHEYGDYMSGAHLKFEDKRSIMLLDYEGKEGSGIVSSGRKKLPSVVSVSVLRAIIDSLEFFFGPEAFCTVMGLTGANFSMLTICELLYKNKDFEKMDEKERINAFLIRTRKKIEERGLGLLKYNVERETVFIELSEAAGFGLLGRCKPLCEFKRRVIECGLSRVVGKTYECMKFESFPDGCKAAFAPIDR